jgi:hypothetical protein
MQTQRHRLSRKIRLRLSKPAAPDRYQRTEYLTAAERNQRYDVLRQCGACGVVRYSGPNVAGVDVYVVAWLRGDVPGMTPANREGRGGPPYSDSPANLEKIGLETVSMEMSEAQLGKLGNSDSKSVSMETP